MSTTTYVLHEEIRKISVFFWLNKVPCPGLCVSFSNFILMSSKVYKKKKKEKKKKDFENCIAVM